KLGQKARRLPREATHGRVGFGPVGHARGVAEVDDVPGREEPPQVAHDGEAADARIEDAERVLAAAGGAAVPASEPAPVAAAPLHRQSLTRSGESTSKCPPIVSTGSPSTRIMTRSTPGRLSPAVRTIEAMSERSRALPPRNPCVSARLQSR